MRKRLMAVCVTASLTASVIALLVALDTDWPPRWPGTEPTTTTTTTIPATTMPTPSPPFSGEELDFINAYAALTGLDLRVSEQGIHDGGVFTPWLSKSFQAQDKDWDLLGFVLVGKTWCVGGVHDEIERYERVEEDPDATEGRRVMVFAALAYLC